MKKVINVIICSILTFMLTSNIVLAQVSYTIEDINADVPGLTQIGELGGKNLYKFKCDGNEYYMFSGKSRIIDYKKDVFDFFVKKLGTTAYIWTGKYYMIYSNDISWDMAYNTDQWKTSHGKIMLYDENFNLTKEYTAPSYIAEAGCDNGIYYYKTLDGTTYVSSDAEQWELGERNPEQTRKWHDTYISADYVGEQYILINHMSFDGDKFYDICYEKNCDQVKSFSGELRTVAAPYIIRNQRTFSENETHSWIGISKDNVYYTYIDLNSIQFGNEDKKRVEAYKVFATDDYLYMELEEKMPFSSSKIPQQIRIKIPLSEIEAELNASIEAPIVVYNNKILGFENVPVIENGNTLVPIRFLFEQMGADVDWEQSTQTATISQNNTTISFDINNPVARVNGKNATMNIPAQLINGKTMVPVRFLSEELGYTVNWDGDKRIITIE